MALRVGNNWQKGRKRKRKGVWRKGGRGSEG